MEIFVIKGILILLHTPTSVSLTAPLTGRQAPLECLNARNIKVAKGIIRSDVKFPWNPT